MKHKMTEAEMAAQIAQLVAMSDSAIDTIDIPEAPLENWALAKRPGLYKPLKKPVTLRLDTDVVSWFKDHAQSDGYQTDIRPKSTACCAATSKTRARRNKPRECVSNFYSP